MSDTNYKTKEGPFVGRTHKKSSKRKCSESLKAFYKTAERHKVRKKISKVLRGIPKPLKKTRKPDKELIKRNNTIIRLYVSDQTKYSSKKLSSQFELSLATISNIINKNGNGPKEKVKNRNSEAARLRELDPIKWTLSNLADHFNVSYNVIVKILPRSVILASNQIVKKENADNIIELLKMGKNKRQIYDILNIPRNQIDAASNEYKKGN